MRYLDFTAVLIAIAAAMPLAAENRIDGQSPDAPALSAYGQFSVGVRQLNLVNKDQVNIGEIKPAEGTPPDLPIYDRPLTVEMWYPSVEGAVGDTSIDTVMRDGTTAIELVGRAVRDAAPLTTTAAAPLVILSHGYPGNRFLMSHLAENLASKGYVVASIDHTDSTYDNIGAFSSTLVNRSLDQLFVLNELARLNNDVSSAFAGRINTDNTGLVGYSMGGYGAIVTAGGGVTEALASNPFASPQGVLGIHQAGSATHEALPDPRIKTAIAIGPFGNRSGFWDAEGLAGIEIPMMFIAGSNDAVSGYDPGIRGIFEGAVNVDRALLTFEGGGHNVAAPIPAPAESFQPDSPLGFDPSLHYTDPVWNTVFSNNIGQHFMTSWLDLYLKGDLDKSVYLDLIQNGDEGIWSQNPDGTFNSDHTYWAGFKEGTANGLQFERLAPIPLPASVWLLGMAIGGLGALHRRRAKRV